jgi:hypothetical protein
MFASSQRRTQFHIGEPAMTTFKISMTQKFVSLAAAAALFLPCAMATMAQAAQIVA